MYQEYGQPSGPQVGGLAIKFYKKSVKDEAASAAAGVPRFKDVEYIIKRVPGDNNCVSDRPIREEDKRQFSRQYEDWKRGLEQTAPGTPLTEWPGLAASQVDTLRHAHITTVEQLAEVSDQNLSKLGMGYDGLRTRARDYLAAAKGMAPLDALRKQHDEALSQLEMTRKQVAELRAEVESLRATTEAPAPRRGRGQSQLPNVT